MCKEPNPSAKKKTKKKTVSPVDNSIPFEEDLARVVILRQPPVIPLAVCQAKTYNELGLLRIDGNSCWCDSALFALFSVRSPVIHRALLVEPVIGIPQINHPPIRGVEVVNIVADTRRRILLARQALRAHLIGIQNHIFNPPNPRNRLSIRNPFRQFLGSLQLTNWNWGGGDQCNSEEFIWKLLDLLPVREEEKLVIFKRQGYAATDQELTLPHTDLEARQVQIYGAVNMQLQENHNNVFSDTFKYGQKDISRNSGGSIVMTITRHMLIHAQENVRRFGRRESGISLLSELLFEKQIIPDVRSFIDKDFVVDITINTNFTSVEHVVSCPGGILMVHLYRIPALIDPGIALDNMEETPVIPDFVIYPNGNPIPLYLSAIIVKSGGVKGGHYTIYFRQGLEFYFFNDGEAEITRIGNYRQLLQKEHVLDGGVFVIYKEEDNISQIQIAEAIAGATNNIGVQQPQINTPAKKKRAKKKHAKEKSAKKKSAKNKSAKKKSAKNKSAKKTPAYNNDLNISQITNKSLLLTIAQQMDISNLSNNNTDTIIAKIKSKKKPKKPKSESKKDLQAMANAMSITLKELKKIRKNL